MNEESRRILPRTGYPRRRAVAACLTCRERKRKCDNLRPTCSSCERIGAPCEYIKQDDSAFDPASLRIIEQLSTIERLVRDIHPSSLNILSSPAQPRHDDETPAMHPSEDHGSLDTSRVVFSLNLDASIKAAIDKILQWPIFEKLLSPLDRFRFVDLYGSETYTYLDDLLNRPGLSTSRSIAGSSWNSMSSVNISTERSDIEQLVDQFFKRVNIKNPILNRRVVGRYCQQYYEDGPLFNLETCLVLLVCALGAISVDFDPLESGQSPGSSSHPSARLASLKLGHCYFAAAEKRLGMAMSSVENIAIECLCLAGIYHMYSINPMSALTMFHAAGSSLQILISTGAGSTEGTSQINSSLFWTCYKSEREILAEIPISTPALREPGARDSYPPPPQPASTTSDEWAASEEDSWYFLLSEIALRRITDQVAEVVAKHIDASISSHALSNIDEIIPIVAEFERQTQEFREQLPPSIQFEDVPLAASTEWKHYSRGRYYRVLELMHRPFLFAALHDAGCGPVGRAFAEKALFNALRYLQHSHSSHRHHGLWVQLRNGLREASLLLAASRSGGLTMPEGWEAAVAKTLATFEYWSWEFPPCKTYAGVIQTLADASGGREDVSAGYS